MTLSEQECDLPEDLPDFLANELFGEQLCFQFHVAEVLDWYFYWQELGTDNDSK